MVKTSRVTGAHQFMNPYIIRFHIESNKFIKNKFITLRMTHFKKQIGTYEIRKKQNILDIKKIKVSNKNF